MRSFWEYSFLGNTTKEWAFALGIVIVCFIAIKFFKSIIMQRLKTWSERTKTTIDDFLALTIEKSVLPLLYIGGIYLAVNTLNIPLNVQRVIHIAFLFVITFFALRILTSTVKEFVFSFIKTQENSELKEKQARGLLIIVNIVIWILGIIFLIDNLGYDITTLVAGLGIGGIAIALAAQTILGDLFSYFVIFFDRPFEIGDFIIVDDKMGTVEYIGIKTTRIRTLGGDQLVCSNTDLTNSRVHNYKRMERRRVVFKLGVIYETSLEQLKKIPEIVKNIIEKMEGVTLDRGHFSGYGDFSLDFEFVYYVEAADYNLYMDKQQAIYLEIFDAFTKEEIEFAYPTQKLFVDAAVQSKNNSSSGSSPNTVIPVS